MQVKLEYFDEFKRLVKEKILAGIPGIKAIDIVYREHRELFEIDEQLEQVPER